MLGAVGLTRRVFAFSPKIWFAVVHVGDVVPDTEYQLYVYGEVPPIAFALRVTLCPEFIVGFEGVIRPAVRAGLIVISLLMLLTVAGVEAESVIKTFADIVLPASAVGTSHRKVLLVPVMPVYKAFAIRASVTVLNTR